MGLLVDELEKLKTELDTERHLHRSSHENLETVEQNRRRIEQDLRTSSDELSSLAARLENEKKLRLVAEEKADTATREQKRLEEELRAQSEERDHQEHERAGKDPEPQEGSRICL